MSTTVNEAFNLFNRDFVSLDSERTKIARRSRDWLLTQLVNLPNKFSDFPKLYDGKHVNFGSFARNTKIRELDDIDLILAFSAEKTTYNAISFGKEYTLRPPSEAENLKSRCNDDGTLNSIMLINMLVSALGEIDQYQSSEKHRAQEAATLQLSSYEWCYDIVPAFYTDTGYYLIPDGQGRWKATDPRIDENRVITINQQHGCKLLQIIRALKFWNERAMMVTVPSYLFENIVLNYFHSKTSITDYIDFSLRDFWGYLITGIHYKVPDPKSFQGELNTLSWEDRSGIANKATEAFQKAKEAIVLETSALNPIGAIRKWAEIFGPNFK
jgi:hypothetical protein